MKFQVVFDNGGSTMHVSFTNSVEKNPDIFKISCNFYPPNSTRMVIFLRTHLSTSRMVRACFPHAQNVNTIQ